MGMCKLMVLVLFSEGATALSFRDFLWGPNWLRPILNLWKKVSIPAQAPAAQPQMPNNVIPAQAPVNSVNSIPNVWARGSLGHRVNVTWKTLCLSETPRLMNTAK